MPYTSRRDVLGWTAKLIAAHTGLGMLPVFAQKTEAPRILSLELLTAAPLGEMREFYHGRLGLRVVEERGAARITFAAGATRLSFVPAGEGQPFYHFAFNI